MLEVTLEGEPDPVTGMVLDLKALKEILNHEVIEPFDHRFLNHEVQPFDRVVPTPENIAREIWRRLAPHFAGGGPRLGMSGCSRPKTCLWTTREHDGDSGMIRVTRQYRFSASHRLHAPSLNEEENRALFGKCNNPYGHGHDYVLEVSVRGPVDEETGLAVDTSRLDGLVENSVLRDVRTTDLNHLPDFAARVPTTENLGGRDGAAGALLAGAFPGQWPTLDKVRIQETRRNRFEIAARGRRDSDPLAHARDSVLSTSSTEPRPSGSGL